MLEDNPKFEKCSKRVRPLYHRDDDIRSCFARDYNRILHSTAYRRLKHKTQVFFATTNDHVCTRMEHVNHVTAVSYTIAKYLGLNTELTNAIALGHDLGHAPFGHAGEAIIKKIIKDTFDEPFWHEKNSLRFVDCCETLEDTDGKHQNLNLTYGVRDGIISHCGEVDENGLMPREDDVDLNLIVKPNEFAPFTWEGCVVKISDKIAYLGRDIEDAISLKILLRDDIEELVRAVRPFTKAKISQLNNTVIMHDLIIDLCNQSSIYDGICLSSNNLELMNKLKEFNYKRIYDHWKIENYKSYAKLIIESIYNMLKRFYNKNDTIKEITKYAEIYPNLCNIFSEWLSKYSQTSTRETKYQNIVLYDLDSELDYTRSIVDFISGMTDSFAIKLFNEITTF